MGAQRAEQGLKDRDRDQAGHQHVERGQTVMHQHLVDHHLEKQRRDQRKQLQEERSDQHLGQEPAIFVHRLQEPADVELAREVGERGPARHHQQFARPFRLEFAAVQELRPADRRVLHHHLVLAGLADNEKAAVLAPRDRRQRGRGEPGIILGDDPSLEPERPGAAHHLRQIDGDASYPMADLFRLGRDLVEAQQQNKTGKSGIPAVNMIV